MRKWILCMVMMTMTTLAMGESKKRYVVQYRKTFESGVSALTHTEKFQVVEMNDEEVEQLKSRTDVSTVEEDILVQHTAFSESDSLIPDLWHYNDSQGGIQLSQAWEVSSENSIVVAVVDTGITSHPDLDANVLQGADFITDLNNSRDGDLRDHDASDPGDYVQIGDPCYTGTARESSWHGTHVSGTIASVNGNSIGISGVSPFSKILPLRVLGPCGGYTSDIADAIRWAAGGTVSGLSNNPNPAKVINLSLGGQGNCSTFMQDAINYAISQGAVVVAAAGNSGLNMDIYSFTPASCSGVVTVGATDFYGQQTSYSNFGSVVDVMAPGGDEYNKIISTHNDGYQFVGLTSYSGMAGTSMAAPHVAGALALLFANDSTVNSSSVVEYLKSFSDSMASSDCSSGGCGSGKINIFSSLSALKNQIVVTPSEPVNANIPIVVDVDSEKTGGTCGTVDTGSGGSGGGPSLLIGLLLSLALTQFNKRYI